MAKLVNWYEFERRIKDKKIPLFSADDIGRLFGTSKVATTFLLHRYSRKKFIIRIKRGFYALPSALPPDFLIANKIVKPSYISLEFALSYHRVIPETVYEITSVTTKSTRRFEALGIIYSYRTIKKDVFTGYGPEYQNGFCFFIADPEKAFVDANYFRMLDGLMPLSRFDKEKINPKKALKYAGLFGNKKLVNIVRTALQ